MKEKTPKKINSIDFNNKNLINNKSFKVVDGILLTSFLFGNMSPILTMAANEDFDEEFVSSNVVGEINSITGGVDISTSEDVQDCVYLSDLNYLTTYPMRSSSGYGGFKIDKNYNNSTISVKIENGIQYFDKGVGAHATSTLYYDLSDLDYDYFVCWGGIDTSQGGTGNGATLYIYTSMDGVNWELKTSENPTTVKGDTNAQYFKIALEGAKYLKLYAYDNGANGNDHVVWADAKFVKSDYKESYLVPSVEELDEQIADMEEGTEEYQSLIFKRTLIDNAGQYTLSRALKESEYVQKAYDWLFEDNANIEMYLLGGEPSGTYGKSLEVLGRLLEEYGDDLENEKYGSTYKTMMIALSLTHSTTVRFWISDVKGENEDGSDTSGSNSKNVSNPLTRYKVYKKMMSYNKLHSMFYNLTVEEMRLVMNTKMSDSEIEWLRDYSYNRDTVGYLSYSDWWITYENKAYMWHNDAFYDMDTIESYSEQYGDFLKYGVEVQKYNPSLWMVYASWGICWHISNTGANVVASQGVPTLTLGQPGHVAYVYFEDTGSGNTKYVSHYFVSNWNQSTFTTYTGDKGYYVNRPYMNWGVGSYTNYTYNASYLWLSQKALDNYDDFSKSEKTVMIANAYSSNPQKQKELYLRAIEECQYNFDAYLQLVYLYRDVPEIATDNERIALAKTIVENLEENPLPVNDLWVLLNAQIEDATAKMQMSIVRSNALYAYTNSSNDNVKNVATMLTGDVTKNAICTFSFDGDDANKIVLTEQYSTLGVNWNYSLDGGQTWSSPTDALEIELSDEEVSSINATDDIKIHLMGTTYEDENLFVIDITKGVLNTGNLYKNDLENRVMGVTDKMEWTQIGVIGDSSYVADGVWKSFAEENPRWSGNEQIQIRTKATGTTLASDTVTYRFWKDVHPDTRLYIPIENITVDSWSSERSGQKAAYANNGYPSSYWQTTTDDEERWVVYKLDKPRYISGIGYLGYQNSCRIKGLSVYTSMDGENWTLVTDDYQCPNTQDYQMQIPVEETTKALYVKFQVNSTHDGDGSVAASMLYLFEDTTMEMTSEASIEYSTTKTTNKNVTVTLTSPYNVTVLNNDGSDTYTFTENGEFTFEYVDEFGIEDSITAVVDWIDKETPVATVEYSTTTLTCNDVTATITFNEDVTFMEDEDDDEELTYEGYEKSTLQSTYSNSYSFVFTSNGEKSFDFMDKAGNITTIELNVDWIDKIPPTGDISYDIESTTNKNVVATLTNLSEDVTILNNNGSSTYTFTENGEFTFKVMDKAGNVNNITAMVDWIDKEEISYEVSYSTSEVTNSMVTASITFNKDVELVSRVLVDKISNKEYNVNFSENEDVSLVFEDKAGNRSVISLSVDWIDNDAPTGDIVYDITSTTNQNVTATLSNLDDDVIIVNNNGSASYTFEENGMFVFELQDKAGNISYITASVSWIDKVAPIGEVVYEEKNGKVIATLTNLNKKNVTVTNNNGSSTYTFDKNGEFTFELKDEAGNIGKVVAKTSSIKEETSSSEETLVNIRYSTTSLTSGTVLATIYSNKELTVTNNGGSNVYEFDKNGDFTFKYIDGDGKEGSLTATVSWIQKSNTTTSSTDTSNSEASTTTNNSPSNTSQSNSTNSETTDNTDKNTDANVSQTGDKNNILLFAGIGFISLVGMFIGLKNNKKD
jgi:hypothetical protein